MEFERIEWQFSWDILGVHGIHGVILSSGESSEPVGANCELSQSHDSDRSGVLDTCRWVMIFEVKTPCLNMSRKSIRENSLVHGR